MTLSSLPRLPAVAAFAADTLAQWLGRMTVAALVAICGVFALVMWDARMDALREATTAAENLSAAVTQDVARNIEVIDLSLQSVVDGLGDPEVMGLKPSLRKMILFDRAVTARYLGGTFVLDENGRIVIDAQSDTPEPADLSDRDYFAAHRAERNLGLFVSTPFVSRVSGEWSIALSRRFNHPDGSFAGVVVAGLRLTYFRDLFSRMRLGRNGSMTLVRKDGVLLMREPFSPSALGRSIADTTLFKTIAAERSGRVEAIAAVDGQRRLYTFRHVGDLPLIQNVGTGVDDVFASWWRKALTLGATLLVLCSIVLWLISVLNVQLRRRAEAETALAAIAMTDKLTALANRRSFDEALEAEWRRAMRDRRPVSLLMLDADSFKSFNDRYGHLAGDGVLTEIGRCIAASIRRPGDLAARYGGEEFAMLLPGTDAASAFQLGETVRLGVLDYAEPHAGSPLGTVTVSIGVATLVPAPNQPASDLVAAADAALYGSKWSGRNRTTLASGDGMKLAA